MMSENSAEMPHYKCHKEVHALKIVQIDRYKTSHFTLHFEEGYMPKEIFEASAQFLRFANCGPDDFGYYIVYKDGYVSWSPTEAFEEGYTRL